MKFPVTLAVKDCTNMVPQKVLTKRKLLAQYLLLYPIYTVIALAALCGLLAVLNPHCAASVIAVTEGYAVRRPP